jgi:hypothetical protein
LNENLKETNRIWEQKKTWVNKIKNIKNQASKMKNLTKKKINEKKP